LRENLLIALDRVAPVKGLSLDTTLEHAGARRTRRRVARLFPCAATCDGPYDRTVETTISRGLRRTPLRTSCWRENFAHGPPHRAANSKRACANVRCAQRTTARAALEADVANCCSRRGSMRSEFRGWRSNLAGKTVVNQVAIDQRAIPGVKTALGRLRVLGNGRMDVSTAAARRGKRR